MNYGQKGVGQKLAKIAVSAYESKRLAPILSISSMCVEVGSAFIMLQTGTIHYFPFWNYGPKGGLWNGQKLTFLFNELF